MYVLSVFKNSETQGTNSRHTYKAISDELSLIC